MTIKSMRGLFSVILTVVMLGDIQAAPKKKVKMGPVWTSVEAADLPADYAYQGEYRAEAMGCQVIALGKGSFQAVLLPGGLPGAGWDGKNKGLMAGTLVGDRVTFKPATGNRQYVAGPPDQFSATGKYPPTGHKPYSGKIKGESLTITAEGGKSMELKKILRKSDTLGMKPATGAIVLFDGSNTDAFTGGRLDEKTGFLHTDGADIRTQKPFADYRLHLEFMLPFRPEDRGQKRGNSGLYHCDLYETQVLDSFGLDGRDNECGGLYKTAIPSVNMCFPPLTWQTYDVEMTAAVVKEGKKVKNARITVKLNGVLIHDDVELPKPTGGAAKKPEGAPGSLRLQGHKNPLQYRNIWIVDLDG